MFYLHVCMYIVCVPGAQGKEGIGFPGSVAKDGCETPCGFWEASPGPPGTDALNSSLQPPSWRCSQLMAQVTVASLKQQRQKWSNTHCGVCPGGSFLGSKALPCLEEMYGY